MSKKIFFNFLLKDRLKGCCIIKINYFLSLRIMKIPLYPFISFVNGKKKFKKLFFNFMLQIRSNKKIIIN